MFRARPEGARVDAERDHLEPAAEAGPDTVVARERVAHVVHAAADHGARRARGADDGVVRAGVAEQEIEPFALPDHESALDDEVGDDLLRLIFVACHSILPTEARTALTLRLLGGLTTPEIARAFLVPEPTMAQRIVRAKRQLEGFGGCQHADLFAVGVDHAHFRHADTMIYTDELLNRRFSC